MYCVVAKNVNATCDLATIKTYGPFVSELLAQTFARRRLQLQNTNIEWRIAALLPDVVTGKAVKKSTDFPSRVKVSFPAK